MTGIDGSLSGPLPSDQHLRRSTRPRLVMMRQRLAIARPIRAAITSWSKRMCGTTPKRAAQSRRYAWISR